MNHEFQQYRLAHIEGYNITRARLQSQFTNGIGALGELEKAIAEQLAMPPAVIAAWRRSEMEQAGCREGVRLAALEFYWEQHEQVRAGRQSGCVRKGAALDVRTCSSRHRFRRS